MLWVAVEPPEHDLAPAAQLHRPAHVRPGVGREGELGGAAHRVSCRDERGDRDADLRGAHRRTRCWVVGLSGVRLVAEMADEDAARFHVAGAGRERRRLLEHRVRHVHLEVVRLGVGVSRRRAGHRRWRQVVQHERRREINRGEERRLDRRLRRVRLVREGAVPVRIVRRQRALLDQGRGGRARQPGEVADREVLVPRRSRVVRERHAKAAHERFAQLRVPERVDGALGLRLGRPDAVRAQPGQARPLDRRIPVRVEAGVAEQLAAWPQQFHYQAMAHVHGTLPASTFGWSTTRSPGSTASATRSEPSRCRPSRSDRA